MQIVFSNRAYLAVLSETYEKIKTETGGLFLGCYENGTWYVIETIDPGPNSIFQVAYFEYDQKYTSHLINKIARLYQSKLTLIGLWHRHPGSFDQFSPTDDGTNSDYAKLTTDGAISILVNIDPQFRITPYHVVFPLRYTMITYKVGDDLIPKHLLQMKEAKTSLESINKYADKSHSGKSTAVKPKIDFVRLLEGIKSQFQSITLSKDDYSSDEAEPHRSFLIDSLLDDITYLSEICGLALNIEQTKDTMCLSHKGVDNTVTSVNFTFIASQKLIVFSYGDVCYSYMPGLFAELLATYTPSETTFMSELKRFVGIRGNDVSEESKHEK